MQRKKFVNALIITALFLPACTDGQTTDIQTQSREVDDLNIMNDQTAGAPEMLAANGLVMKGSKYLGDITEADFDDLISGWIADDSYFVADFAIVENGISFDVRKQRDIIKIGMSEADWRTHARTLIKEVLRRSPNPVTGKGEIFWNYKGLDFSTICAVARKEDGKFDIVWDNISSNILIPGKPVINETTEEAVLSESPRTRSDGELQANRGFYNPFYAKLGGELAAYVEYMIIVRGYERYGTNAIAGETSHAGGTALRLGWSADCQIQLVQFETGPTGIARYVYAWGASGDLFSSVNIQFKGYGFEISGVASGMSGSGTETISASELVDPYEDIIIYPGT